MLSVPAIDLIPSEPHQRGQRMLNESILEPQPDADFLQGDEQREATRFIPSYPSAGYARKHGSPPSTGRMGEKCDIGPPFASAKLEVHCTSEDTL